MSDNKTEKDPLPDLSARINLDVKTEIPAEASGNLLSALTDLIRPISEWTGLKGDQIRLQRLDTLIEIARRTREIRKLEDAPLVPVSLKFLVPFLEQGSRENIDSEMVDWWAKLLSSASIAEDNQQPTYANILAGLTGKQAKLASELWNQTDRNSYVSESSAVAVSMLKSKMSNIGKITTEKYNNKKSRDQDMYGIIFAEDLPSVIGEFPYAGLFISGIDIPNSAPISIGVLGDPVDYDALEVLGLFRRHVVTVPVPTPWIGEFSCEIYFGTFTALGAKLMQICHTDLEI